MRTAVLRALIVTMLVLSGSSGIAQQEASTPEEIAKRMIVMITCQFAGAKNFGAGIILGEWDDRLYIATARHVLHQEVEDKNVEGKNVKVQLKWLRGEWFDAAVLNTQESQLDIALLIIKGVREKQISTRLLRLDRLGEPALLKARDNLWAIGYPGGKAWHVNATLPPLSGSRRRMDCRSGSRHLPSLKAIREAACSMSNGSWLAWSCPMSRLWHRPPRLIWLQKRLLTGDLNVKSL
jgi:hypothetical protein